MWQKSTEIYNYGFLTGKVFRKEELRTEEKYWQMKKYGFWGSWVFQTPSKQPPEAPPNKTDDMGPPEKYRNHLHEW